MKREEYIKKLSKLIKGLPKEEKEDIISDYEEHFAIGLEKGRNEEEISKALGDPKTVAKQIKADYMVKKAEDKPSPGTIIEAILAVAGLGLLNLMLVAIPALVVAVVILSLIVAGLSVIFAGIITILSPLLQPIFPQYIDLPVKGGIMGTFIMIIGGIGLTVLGTFFVVIVGYVAKWFYKFIIKLLKSNLDDIKEKSAVLNK